MKLHQFPALARVGALLLAALLLAPQAHACSVCFGKAGSPMTEAANGAIIFMLALLVAVLGSFIGFFVYLARKARNPLADHEILGQMIAADEQRKVTHLR